MCAEKNNVFIYRMKENMKEAMKFGFKDHSCAEEIKPMIESFYNQSINVDIKWDGANVCWNIEKTMEIMKYIAHNTRNTRKLSAEEVETFKKIFDELNVLQAETLELASLSKKENTLYDKMDCICEIACKNSVVSIFRKYEYLWQIIHRVNTEWDDLCSRGFSLKVFYDFWDAFIYDISCGQRKTEEENLENFMALLDGKMKFVPVYVYKPVCFKLVGNDYEGEVIIPISKNELMKPYRMRQHGEDK